MNDALEQTARRIAQGGRDALVVRLRWAFRQAATRYEDVVELDAPRLERMVQDAADRADGVQWRRALAGVATQELGIGLGEALSHPAVIRAQAIVGAPSYEESLAALAAPSQPETPAPQPDVPSAAPPTEERADPVPGPPLVADPETTPAESPPAPPAPPTPLTPPDPPDPPTPAEAADLEPDAVRLTAVHMGGIGNLASGEGSLELRFSEVGLEIIRTENGSTVGRLPWAEIEVLEVPSARGGLRRRRRRSRAQLLVRTERGEAQFEIPGISDVELSQHLAPMLERARGARDSG